MPLRLTVAITLCILSWGSILKDGCISSTAGANNLPPTNGWAEEKGQISAGVGSMARTYDLTRSSTTLNRVKFLLEFVRRTN
jgi:hypothetical protein